MDTKQLKYVLEELNFSAPLPQVVIDKLAAESTVEEFSAGSFVFREGGANSKLYLVRSGRLALEMGSPGSGAIRILTIGPGEMVGWSAMLGEGKMTASAVAVEDSELVAATADKLRELCENNHEFGYRLMRRMAWALSKRLVATRLQLLDLFADAPSTIPAEISKEE